jgi:hypothetical protein
MIPYIATDGFNDCLSVHVRWNEFIDMTRRKRGVDRIQDVVKKKRKTVQYAII